MTHGLDGRDMARNRDLLLMCNNAIIGGITCCGERPGRY